MKVDLPLMKNLLTPLPKSVLIPLALTVAVSASDAAIQKNIHGSVIITLTILNEKIMKIVKSLEEAGSLIKGASETIENEAKEQKGNFLACYYKYIRCQFIKKIC